MHQAFHVQIDWPSINGLFKSLSMSSKMPHFEFEIAHEHSVELLGVELYPIKSVLKLEERCLQ